MTKRVTARHSATQLSAKCDGSARGIVVEGPSVLQYFRSLSRSRIGVLVLLASVVTGCESSPVAPTRDAQTAFAPLVPNFKYDVPTTSAEYRKLIDANSSAYLLCNATLRAPSGDLSFYAFSGRVPITITAPAVSPPPMPSALPPGSGMVGEVFRVARRYLDSGCSSGRIRGRITENLDGEIDFDDSQPEDVPNPPGDAPPGMEQDIYDGLNAAEREVVWSEFTADPANFAQKLRRWREIKQLAERWSEQVAPDGATGGPQDAMRHAYWQCELARYAGEAFAERIGTAHEHGRPVSERDHVRMDLFNNRAGRTAARWTALSCAQAVLELKRLGMLRLTVGPVWGGHGGGQAPGFPFE